MFSAEEKLAALVEDAFYKCHSTICAKECEYFDKTLPIRDRSCQGKMFAHHLISNGVTIQQWISVEERLPEDSATILVCHRNGFVTTNAWLGTRWWYKNEKNTITHWMPLPEPPKGE